MLIMIQNKAIALFIQAFQKEGILRFQMKQNMTII